MKFTPRDYQARIIDESVPILKANGLLLLYMDMRTGKTPTSLAITSQLLRNSPRKRVLFVTVANKNAQSSIRRDATWFPELDVEIISNMSIYKAKHFKEHITRAGAENKKLRIPNEIKSAYDLVIVDEAHNFKGTSGKATNKLVVARRLLSHFPMIQMTGTPVNEGWDTIYNQLSISKNTPFLEYPTFYKWADVFCKKKEMMLKGGRRYNVYTGIQDRIEPFIYQIRQTLTWDEAGFTFGNVDEIEHHIKTPLIIENLIAEIVKDGTAGFAGRQIITDGAAGKQSKVLQLSSGHVIVRDPLTNESEYLIVDNFKVEYLITRLLPEFNKIGIYYKYLSEYEMLKGLPNVTQSADVFNSSDESIFIGNIKSACEGVSLKTADVLVYFNLDFSSAKYEQSKARLNHLVREDRPRVHILMADKGIEKNVLKALRKKESYSKKMFMNDYNIKEI